MIREHSNRRTFLAAVSAGAVSLTGCAARGIATKLPPVDDSRSTPSPDTRTPETGGQRTEPSGDPFAGFNDLSNWKVPSGSLGTDTTDPYDSDHSVRLTTELSDKIAMARYDLPSPADLSEHHLTLAYKYASESFGYKLTIQLLAPDTDNVLIFERAGRPGNGWVHTALSTPDSVVGTPDLSDVRSMLFSQYTGGNGTVDISLDALVPIDRRGPPTVIFTFDDGIATVWEHARPVLAEYEFAASIAAIPGRESRSGFLTLDQLHTFQSNGWDIMSHPQEHDPLTDFGREGQSERILGVKDWLVEHGFEDGSRFIVYPYSQWDQTTLSVAEGVHDIGFANMGVTAQYSPMPLVTSRINGDDIERVKGYVDRLQQYGGVMPLSYHAVDEGDWISAADFAEIVSYIASAEGVEVQTVGEWYDATKQLYGRE